MLTGHDLVEPSLWMRDHLAAGSVIATRRLGALAYFSGLQVFDYAFGLTDREVARRVRRAGRYFDTRITSYNVCYTKLLRTCSVS